MERAGYSDPFLSLQDYMLWKNKLEVIQNLVQILMFTASWSLVNTPRGQIISVT